MTIVVDASAAYDLLTQATCQAKIVGASELIAPDLIVPELLNARWKVSRSGVPAPKLEDTLEFLSRLRILPTLPYASAAAALAEKLDHPIYDCLYLAMAKHEGAKLLTVDQRMSKKIASTAIAKMLL